MATAQEVQVLFITPLEAVLGEPRWKGIDPIAFYEALTEDLVQFSTVALTNAMRTLRREKKSFPMINECVDACWSAKGVLTQEKLVEGPRYQKAESPWNWETYIKALRLVRTNQLMAHTADRNGWLCRLIEFAESEHRLPTDREIHRLIEKSMESERKCEVPGNQMLTDSLSKLRKAMLDRAHRDVFRDGDPVRRTA